MSQFICFLSCAEHSFDACLVKGSDVDIKTAAYRCDILHILRLVGHDRTAAAGQKHICHIIYSYVVCNIMYQRYCISYIFQIFSHRMSTFSVIHFSKKAIKKREALKKGTPASVVYLCSLRWHYPNQVAGRSDSSSSQPA